jgi:N-acylneuraminate cytidylyltransferase
MKDLINGYNLLINNDIDIIYPITPFSYPILRSLIIDENGLIQMKWPEYLKSRSQDLQEFYHDCGQWYWYNGKALVLSRFEKIKPIIINNIDVQDIDNEEDWKIAELKYKYGNNIL